MTIDGRAAARPEDRPWAVATTVSDSYFSTMGIHLLAGRGFAASDEPGRQPVAIVNMEMARRQFGAPERALGARLSLAGSEPGAGPLQIVGVASDVLRSDREGVNPQIYVSIRQRPSKSLTLMVRAADPDALAANVRAELRALDADVPIYEMRPIRQALDDDLSSSRVLGSLFVSFALLALVLAASGLYAVVSYSASQRIKEFGVRIALGAAPGDITRMMLGQTARLVAIGLVIGLAGGRLLAMGATALLYQVSPSDPATYAAVAIALGSVALVASYVPTRRATSVDPVTALRLE